MPKTEVKLNLDIPESFSSFIGPACVRLGYLFSNLEFSPKERGIVVSWSKSENSPSEQEIRKQVMHQLYRERIFSETLPIRTWMSSSE